MRVSQYFGLSLGQGQLDFVDVPLDQDARLFVDPTAIRSAAGPMRDLCVYLLQSFFQEVIRSIHTGDDARARGLLERLSEPSETHLGYASRGSYGLGVGLGRADDILHALKASEAVKSGLLKDLEDTALLIDGIDVDIVSDITTNVIRESLIAYTQAMATTYGITLASGVASGPLWNPTTCQWDERFVELPMTENGKVILVPKLFVRRTLTYAAQDYYTHYVLVRLQREHISARSPLVHILKSGEPRVYKKDLRKKYGESKQAILAQTLKYPGLLEQYRADKRREPRVPVSEFEYSDRAGYDVVDWKALLDGVLTVPRGATDASLYHDKAFGLLSALFAPELTWPEKEEPLHSGRKRVDIVFTNGATSGFFAWVAEHYGAPYVFVECKNYNGDPANPELDQLSGRFSNRRGKFGILLCRSLDDRSLFGQRCRDTADDDRGYIVALDDSDLAELVEARMSDGTSGVWRVMRTRFNPLVL